MRRDDFTFVTGRGRQSEIVSWKSMVVLTALLRKYSSIDLVTPALRAALLAYRKAGAMPQNAT
jgi:hypothetical protein